MKRTNAEVVLDMLKTGTHTAPQIAQQIGIKTASARHLVGRLRAEGHDIVHNFNGYTAFSEPVNDDSVSDATGNSSGLSDENFGS